MRAFPETDEELEKEIDRRDSTQARAAAWLALEEAVIVWERHASELKLKYRDSVVGMKHEIDARLPRRTLEGKESRDDLRNEWLEPITALQDDDWELPEPARDAFYAAYNALMGRWGACVLFARAATFEEYDRAQFDELWARWWAAIAPISSLRARLPIQLGCARFIELAAATFAALGIPFRGGEPSARDGPPSLAGEEIRISTWRDGGNVVELKRQWDPPIPMESRDRSFEARISIPGLGAEIVAEGMDAVSEVRITAGADTLPIVHSAVNGAAARLAVRAGQWTNRYAAPNEWLIAARSAVIDQLSTDVRSEPWIVLPNRYAIEVRAYNDPGTMCGHDAYELETIGPLPTGDVVEIDELETDPLDARKVFTAIARKPLAVEPEEVVAQGNMKTERYRAPGWVLRRWSQVIDGRVRAERIFLQGDTAVFLRRDLRTRGVVIGADRERLLRALGAVAPRLGTPGPNQRTKVWSGTIGDDAEEIRAGIALGEDINALDHRGIPPLHNAAQVPRMRALRALLDAGADPDICDSHGQSALRLAAAGGHSEVITELIAHGALVDARDDQGRTPLMFARWSAVGALLAAGAFVDARDKRGRSALHHAAAAGCEDEIGVLLDAGAYINGRDLEGNAPLHLAAQGSYGYADYTGDGREPAGRNEAAHAGAVRALLRRGANRGVENDRGHTPLQCAEIVGNTWIAETLRKR
jgi:hypothetical protein